MREFERLIRIEAPEALGGRPPTVTDANKGNWLDRCLRAVYQPPAPDPPWEPSDRWRTEGDWRPGESEAEGPDLVLVSTPQSAHGRYGFGGLTRKGRRWLVRGSEELGARNGTTAMVTITFSDLNLDRLTAADGLPAFTKHFTERLGRDLRRRGGRAEFCGVWEMQPKRMARTGRPAPHLHVLVRYRSAARKQPFLTVGQYREAVRSSLSSACAMVCDIDDHSVRAEHVRTTCTRYLTRYLKKGSESCEGFRGTASAALVPRQWWLVSKDLRDKVLAHMRQMRPDFVQWIGRNGQQLSSLGLITSQAVHLLLPVPPTWLVFWPNCAAFTTTMELWREHINQKSLAATYALYESEDAALQRIAAYVLPSSSLKPQT